MRFAAHLSLVLMLLTSVAACRKVEARTPSPSPPLDTPAPPGRVIIPVRVEPPEVPAPTPADPASSAGSTPPASPPVRRDPPATTSTPPPVVRTTENVAAIEARTRVLMDQAERDLGRVSYRALGADARDQYDTARRFLRMAGEAVTARNFLYARQLARNAASLAALLVKGGTTRAIAT